MTADNEVRRTEQGHEIDATIVCDFIRMTPAHDAVAVAVAVADSVHDLFFEHVVKGRYHATVVAATLRSTLVDMLDAAASDADWCGVADELIAEAREALLEAEPDRPGAHPRVRFWWRCRRQ